MSPNEIQLIHAHRRWANGKLLRAAARLDPAAYQEAGEAGDSLHGVLSHMLAGLHIWRLRSQEGRSPDALPAAPPEGDLAALRATWEEEERLFQQYLATLDQGALAAPVAYRTTRGAHHEQALWTILVHLSLHDMQHRAEAARMLTRAGQSPGDLDLILYLRERDAASE